MLTAIAAEEVVQLTDEAKAERRRLKEMMRTAEDRLLDPWERYRALTDQGERLFDLTELYDRKTRFALLVLGGLNAINLLAIARLDVLTSLQRGSLFLSVYVGCYVLLSLRLLMYAISALKPRASTVHRLDKAQPLDQGALTLENGILRQTLDEYGERWRQVRIDQINGELVVAAYYGAQANANKVCSLRRVYLGLSVLVALTAAFFIALGVNGVAGRP